MGTYVYKKDGNGKPYPDWHADSLFERDPDVVIGHNYVKFTALAAMGTHADWRKGNRVFRCSKYHNQRQVNPNSFEWWSDDASQWSTDAHHWDVVVNLHQCKSTDRVQHELMNHGDLNKFMKPYEEVPAAAPAPGPEN